MSINGYSTSSGGVERRYVSYGLEPGNKYPYNVAVTYQGKTYEKKVVLTAGERRSFRFNTDLLTNRYASVR